jgi:hypothetical protein
MNTHITTIALFTLALFMGLVFASRSRDHIFAAPFGVVVCAGDCNTNGVVTVDEVVVLVNIVLGLEPPSACPPLTEAPDIGGVIRAVKNVLLGCPPLPTPTPITYRLGEGSTIVYSPPPPKERPTIEEPFRTRPSFLRAAVFCL